MLINTPIKPYIRPSGTVSVVITCKDQVHLVVRTIRSVIQQDFQEAFDILLIDDGSRDGTVPTVRRIFGDRVKVLKKDVPKGWLHSLEVACQETEGGILAFTDPHCAVLSDWLSKIVRSFRSDPTLRIMTGPAVHGYRFMEKLSALTLHGQFVSMERGVAAHIFDGNFAMRKDTLAGLLLRLPVDQNVNDGVGCSLLTSEAKRSGALILHEPGAIACHITPNFLEYLKDWGGISAWNTIEIRLRNRRERGAGILKCMVLAPFIYPTVRLVLDVRNAWRYRKSLRLNWLESPFILIGDIAGKLWYVMGLARTLKKIRLSRGLDIL